MKTITVKNETWEELTRLKLELRNSTIDDTINYLLQEKEGEKKWQ